MYTQPNTHPYIHIPFSRPSYVRLGILVNVDPYLHSLSLFASINENYWYEPRSGACVDNENIQKKEKFFGLLWISFDF